MDSVPSRPGGKSMTDLLNYLISPFYSPSSSKSPKSPHKILVVPNSFSSKLHPSRNFRCMKGNLEKCTEHVGFTDWKTIEKIGEGAYGKLTLYDVMHKGKPVRVAVKVVQFAVHKDDKGEDAHQLDNLYKEVEFNYYMGEVGLGPKLYYAFFEITRDDKYGLEGNQYFIMEPMDTDASKFFRDQTFTVDQKQAVLSKMIKLLYKQIYKYNLYCADTKTPNFLINKDDFKVCLIDFGGDFCNISADGKDIMEHLSLSRHKKKDLFYFSQLLQLRMYIEMYEYVPYNSPIFEPIDNDPIFKKACYFLST